MESNQLNYSEKEFHLLLNVCRGLLGVDTKYPPNNYSQNIQWERFIHLAEQHKILPAIYKGIKKIPLAIPITFSDLLKSKYDEKVFRSMQLTRELSAISSLFQEQDVNFIVLKGPFLSKQLYGDFTSRQFSDLDIVVDITKFDMAVDLILSMGYYGNLFYRRMNPPQYRYYFKYFSDLSFKHPSTDIVVELHWKIWNEGIIGQGLAQHIQNNIQTLNLGNLPIKGLYLPDHLLYLTIHGYKHAWHRLSWLWDVANAFQNLSPEESTSIFRKAEIQKLLTPLIQASILCKRVFGIESQLPINTIHSFSLRNVQFAEKTILSGKPNHSLYAMIMNLLYLMKMKKSFPYRKAILMPYLTHYRDWNALTLPHWLFPLYFILHPFIFVYRRLKK
jgi:hypothetical protein